jgi:hypothetical protein
VINFPPEVRKALSGEPGALENLIVDLEQAVGVYRDHMSGEKRKKVSEWCESFASAWERLVEIAQDAPPGGPAVDLRVLRERAIDERLKAKMYKIENPRNKPRYPGEWNLLAFRTSGGSVLASWWRGPSVGGREGKAGPLARLIHLSDGHF